GGVSEQDYHAEWRMSLKTNALRVVTPCTSEATGKPEASETIGVPVAGVGVWSYRATGTSTQRSLPARPRNVRSCGRNPSSPACAGTGQRRSGAAQVLF